MTDQERFTQVMAVMMDKDTESNWWCEKCQTSVDGIRVTYQENHENCGYPVIWKEGWSPIIENELTPEVRKWWAEKLPEAWSVYVFWAGDRASKLLTYPNKYNCIYPIHITFILDWRNLWKWMRENMDSWLYRECMYKCEVCGKKDCKYYGIGKVAKWDVEKWMEVNIAKEK